MLKWQPSHHQTTMMMIRLLLSQVVFCKDANPPDSEDSKVKKSLEEYD